MVGRRLGEWAGFLVLALVLSSVLVPTWSAAAAVPILARYPYLTDLTSSSVAVTWATSATDTTPGVVAYGTAGNCAESVATAAGPATTYSAFGEAAMYYQHSVQLKNLSPSTAYCYAIYTGSTTPVTALLGSPPRFPTTFVTTPAPGSTNPFSFDVLGDFGETSSTNNAPLGTYNGSQDAVDSQLAASAKDPTSPALFAVSTGDIAYNSGTTTNYGDLNHPADGVGVAETSNIFDARYWGKVGSSLPLFATAGNHGRNSTFLSTWPTSTNVSNSGGRYDSSLIYPPVDGLPGGANPSDWYAFTVGGVRFYILDGDWTDLSQTSYPSLGSGCVPNTCPSYQAERDEHWQQSSTEYTWLANDLQRDEAGRGSSALRMVFFHYPLRVDQNNYTTQQDVYLQNSAANPTGAASSLEALLSAHHVNLVFNGHAHLYERNVAPPGGVPSYVTGGGGAVLTNVAASSACSSTDAYARGWDPTHAVGSSCGSPSGGGTPKPSAAAQVYHFLKISVSGSDVTVAPTDSTGTVFDPVTYDFSADSTSPSTPGAPAAVRGTGSSAGSVTVTLGAAASDNVAVVAYDIYRDGSYRATVPAAVTKWTDVGVPAGAHTWTVKARDQRDNASNASAPSTSVTLPDTTAPTPPGAPLAQVTAGTPRTVGLTWAAATDDVGVASYRVLRNGLMVLSGVTGTSALDASAVDVTSYTYTVTAVDAAGNVSKPSPGTLVTTLDWTPPSPPTLSAATGPPNQIDLSWNGAGDNVSVTGYDVYRDRSTTPAVQGVTSSTWADTGLASGSTHSYVVVARDAAGNSSPPSNTVSATVGATTVPVGPPTSLSVVQRSTPGQVAISWSPPATGSASSYDVYRGSQRLASGTTSTTYLDIAAPDSLPAVYTVTAFDAGGNAGSATVAVTPDWTAPSVPSGLTVNASNTHTATIVWAAATDAVGIAAYAVTRTDAAGNTVTTVSPGTSLSDTVLTAGATYFYSVTARDAAGNTSSPSAAVTLVVPVFAEDFELGALASSVWTPPSAGLAAQQATVHAGRWAAEEVSTGSATWASAQLPSTYRAIHTSAWVYITSRATSAGFLKLRSASGAYIAYLYVNAAGYLSVRNDAGNVTHVSTSFVGIGQWHKVEMYIDTNPGGPIAITAALDGQPAVLTTPVVSTETLGSSPIGQIVLGDNVAGRTYDIAIDDLTVDTRSP